MAAGDEHSLGRQFGRARRWSGRVGSRRRARPRAGRSRAARARRRSRAAACSRPGCPARSRRQDQPARAAPGVLGHLGQLRHVPELVRLAELALADRSRVRVGERDEPVFDRLARHALLDLPGDLLAAVGQLLEPRRRASFAFAPRPRARRRAIAASRRVSVIERSSSSPVCAVSSAPRPSPRPCADGSCASIARSRAAHRPRTIPHPRASARPTSAASLLPSRASARTPCAASPASVGYFTSASITVESIRTARARKRFSRVALHDQRARQLV